MLCYSFSIQFCLHLLALKVILYIQGMLRWYSQIFAKALKITYLAIRILTASGSESLPYQCIYSKHKQNKHPGRMRFSLGSLKIIYRYRANRHEKKTLSVNLQQKIQSLNSYVIGRQGIHLISFTHALFKSDSQKQSRS